ncbi:hypothetical protein STAFG_7848 [Streptomyces afghaniensis 772]|uniref:Uncharacterized protein n=1 Tax=Streptomyces afghaniensis 772 TaxID=1283301 RepID=S4NAP0_9ACTN|nr:hypothetical protein STAFG_7848 [Streptomyces afghaniensis 772]
MSLPDPTHLPNLPHLPPPDPLTSPLTGWTRAHWEAIADRLLDALTPYASPGLAQYRLPGRPATPGPGRTGWRASPAPSCWPRSASPVQAGRACPA